VLADELLSHSIVFFPACMQTASSWINLWINSLTIIRQTQIVFTDCYRESPFLLQ